MATVKPPAPERMAEAFRRLAYSSSNLQTAVDEWKTYISAVNQALHKLPIGVSAWHRIAEGGEDHEWWRREIGYSQIEGNWCLALRRTWGHEAFPEADEEETWRFEDAPKWFMIEAAVKIPDLLETLTQRTEETAEKVRKRSQETAALAAALQPIVEEVKSKEATK